MTDVVPEPERLAPTGDPFGSPSRMEKIDTCVRAFGFRYVDRIKAPEKPAASFGTLVHWKQQLYIMTGILPESEIVQIGAKQIDAGKVAIAGVQYLPLPHPSIKTEDSFEYEAFPASVDTPALWFQGKIDIYDCERVKYQHVNEDGSTITAAFEIGDWSSENEATDATWNAYDSKGRPIPLVIDHKSTGDFKWQKTDDALRAVLDFKGDPQPGFYGKRAVNEFVKRFGERPEWVHFRWVYYLRSEKEHKARCTDLRLTPDEIDEICNRWRNHAIKAVELSRAKVSGHDLPPSLDGCSKFGGCEYGPPTKSSPGNLNICRLTPGERLRSKMTTSTPIADQVRNALSPGGVNPFAPAATAAPTPNANPFAAAPLQAPENITAPAPNANPFAVGAPAPVAANPFSIPPNIAPTIAAVLPAPAANANPFAAFQAPPAVAPAPVDPRLAEVPASIDPAQRVNFLAHCDKHGLDHKTGQPHGMNPAVLPPVVRAAPNPAAEAESYKSIATRMYNERRKPDASAHPEVARMFSALEMINGAIPDPPPAVIVDTPAKRKPGRPKKKDANGVDTAEDEDQSPQIVITVRAIDEIIGFLQSLKAISPP